MFFFSFSFFINLPIYSFIVILLIILYAKGLLWKDWINFCEVGAGGIRWVVPERYHISYNITPDSYIYYYSLISEISSHGLSWIWTGHQKVTITSTSVGKNLLFYFIYLFIYFLEGGGKSLYLTHHEGKCRLNPLSHQPYDVFLLRPSSAQWLSVWLRAEDLWGRDWDSILRYRWLE